MQQKENKDILEKIHREKSYLNAKQLCILNELRKRIFNNLDFFKLITEAEYAIFSEKERSASNNAKRIDYILSKEIEYLIANRKLSEKLLRWFKNNKSWMLVSSAIGGTYKAFSFYLVHKDEIDRLVGNVIDGIFKKTNDQYSSLENISFNELDPKKIFSEMDKYSWIVNYFIAVSINGIELTTDDELIFWLDSNTSAIDIAEPR
jgi:hypothetical protein